MDPLLVQFTNGPGTVSQEGYLQALAVMQQLKELNDSLREKNAELAEEIFDHHAIQNSKEHTTYCINIYI